MLGKRKRDTRVISKRKEEAESQKSNAHTSIDSQDAFRRHFEAMFEPLPEQHYNKDNASSDNDDVGSDEESEVSEWSGLSESGNDLPVVEVVDYANAENGDGDEFYRARQKAFMSSRPPRDTEAMDTTRETKTPDEDDPTEKLNLKHDLDLQRLLKESHLLAKSKASQKLGKERQMALEMRLQALGAKDSILAQHNMPRSHRVGITKRADQKDARRRKEAKENGVILEKASSSNSKTVRRQRGVDVPSIGKFSGGTLKLSQRDVVSIQGPSTVTKRKGRRR